MYIRKVVKVLERYLLMNFGYQLHGYDYSLMIFTPTSDFKYSLVLGATIFDQVNEEDAVVSIFNYLKENLTFDEYSYISRLKIINSNDPVVRNVNFVFPYRNHFIEISPEYYIGGVDFGGKILAKSLVLDKLIEGNALTMTLVSGEQINAGIIRMEETFDIVYYTGKGLREIYKPQILRQEDKELSEFLKKQSEEELMESGHIGVINLDAIDSIL